MNHWRSREVSNKKGFTLVEVIFVAAFSVLIFGSLLLSFSYALQSLQDSRAMTSALSLASNQMEYIRSLDYESIGTLHGIPAGSIPQTNTITENGMDFYERVLVEYVDDPADGLDVNDENGIPSDYKRVKLEYEWQAHNATSTISLVSNIVPRSIETTWGGGTIKINVIDQASLPIKDAEVRLFNNTTDPTIDVTRYTNSEGIVIISGAPAGSDYEVVVTAQKDGDQYSTAGTYQPTEENPNPVVAPFSVLESDVSTLTFQIGVLNDLHIKALSDFTDGSFDEDFSDDGQIADSTNVTIQNGRVSLSHTDGIYDHSGQILIGPIHPNPLFAWGSLYSIFDEPTDTDVILQITTSTSTGLVSDDDLPGNSDGFSEELVDLSTLDVATYPELFVRATLDTGDNYKTPVIEHLSVFYRQMETPFSQQTLLIHGDRLIGTDAGGQPIYKYDEVINLDQTGEVVLNQMEFDSYTIESTGYNIASACPSAPFTQQAGVAGYTEVVFADFVSNTARVSVFNDSGQRIPGATIVLSRSGYSAQEKTNLCGQSYFSSGLNGGSYSLVVSAPGYKTSTNSDFVVAGATNTTVILSK